MQSKSRSANTTPSKTPIQTRFTRPPLSSSSFFILHSSSPSRPPPTVCSGAPSYNIIFETKESSGYEELLGLTYQHFSERSANMNKENANRAMRSADNVRITRSRAQALGPLLEQEYKRIPRTNVKRAASDETKSATAGNVPVQNKKRAVLKDVTNVLCESSYINYVNVAKYQTGKNGQKGRAFQDEASIREDAKAELATELSKIRVADNLVGVIPVKRDNGEISTGKASDHARQDTDEEGKPPSLQKSAHTSLRNQKGDVMDSAEGLPKGPTIVDIDSRITNPQVCTMYAPDIYINIRTKELERRPSTDYMEKLQGDITPSMRGILVDWLVEVSEEYRLVPDTLYLTVNLIDRFLSQNYVGKQRLQLLGVTCMLIASKYEEICAPRVDEFCFITDSTYTKEEVLKQESRVLNHLHFQLSFPTTKSFLRRFIQAAQASSEVPSLEMEFLANYLAELTLIEYSFLKFLPSIIAASAVLLARWTLDQSDNPWNPTLEHYTSYKALELKTAVLAMEALQLNTSGCSLNAVREKYKQQKFRAVATLTSSDSVQSLFQRFTAN